MGLLNPSAPGVDRHSGRYTVFIPARTAGAAPRYVVYDQLAEAKADVDKHRFGYVYAAQAGKAQQLYAAPVMSSFQPPAGSAPVRLSPDVPSSPHVHAARAGVADPIHARHRWVSPLKPVSAGELAQLGAATSGSIRLGAVKPTEHGADVEVLIGTQRPGPAEVKLSLGAQLNGNWSVIFNVPEAMTINGPGWQRATLHLDYAPIETYLQGVSASLHLSGMPLALGAIFAGQHNTGLPGWTGGGSERDALLTLPAKGR